MQISTRIELSEGFVICFATVSTKKGTFTGTSAVSTETSKTIEKESPFEVAETSAVGRALGFANYGLIDGIASADEVVKATTQPLTDTQILANAAAKRPTLMGEHVCPIHNVSMKERKSVAGGTYWDHRKTNEAGEWEKCSGTGFKGAMKRQQPSRLTTDEVDSGYDGDSFPQTSLTPEGLTIEDDIAAHGEAEPTAEDF